jgi:hypothetical protein
LEKFSPKHKKERQKGLSLLGTNEKQRLDKKTGSWTISAGLDDFLSWGYLVDPTRFQKSKSEIQTVF